MCDLALKHFYHRKVKAFNVNVMVCLQFRLDQGKTHLCLLFVKGGRGIEGTHASQTSVNDSTDITVTHTEVDLCVLLSLQG